MMTNMNYSIRNLALTGAVVFGSVTGLLAPTTARAALVTGDATITIDNSAFSSVTGWTVDTFFDASFNTTAINASTTGGTTSTSNMLFPVNNTTTTTFYGNPPNRYLEGTTMDTANTAAGQIGLSGALRMSVPGNPGAGVLTPYDFTLQKFNGTWNLVSHDFTFQGTTFLQLVNVSESVNGSGELSLSGDLILGGGAGPNTYPSIFGLTWSSFLGVPTAFQNILVGSLNLAPSAVPVPAAVWLFGSALAGMVGVGRRKSALAA